MIAENICISDTTVRPRKDIYLFDFNCVNEALINSLVHNDWTITEPQISMFSDRLEILSYGGIPNGMTKEQFYQGISKPRNATLMRIFLNMGLTEHTGHGVPTIIERYGKEVFEIEDNYIKCIIPFEKDVLAKIENKRISKNDNFIFNLNKTEKNVITNLIDNPNISLSELAEIIGVTKRTVERAFKNLQKKNILEKVGTKSKGQWIVVR